MTAPLVLAVDGNSLIHRSYHAQAEPTSPLWAVRGLLGQLVAAVDRIRPDAVVVGFDDPDRSWRREKWPFYKANRAPKLASLVEQLTAAVAAMRDLALPVVVPAGLEADDVLATTAGLVAAAGGRTVIVTSDRDSFALIDEQTSVLRIINGGVDASPLMTPQRLHLLLGVHAGQYRDYAALRGDPSDNLPGVAGIGARSAAAVLAEFGSALAAFDGLADAHERLGGRITRCLSAPEARAAWERNCQVMAMRTDVDLAIDLTTGGGALPVPAAAVTEVYRRHAMTWSVREALAVLAHAEDPGPPRPVYADTAASGSGWAPRRLPRLPAKAAATPAAEQLSLF